MASIFTIVQNEYLTNKLHNNGKTCNKLKIISTPNPFQKYDAKIAETKTCAGKRHERPVWKNKGAPLVITGT